MSVSAATEAALARIARMGGEGGFIAMDKNGNFAIPFNTPGMIRGYVDENGKVVVKLFKGE